MDNDLSELLTRLAQAPETIEFDQTLAVIATHYRYTPTRFINGLGGAPLVNDPGTNEGSCRIFAFARLHRLSAAATLACFGRYYRDDVLKHPDASDHGNIRRFMSDGWDGIRFEGEALTPR